MRHDQQGFSSEFVRLEHSGRTAKLLISLSYTDIDAVRITAPKGMSTDGGSIPARLWRLISPPYASEYLRAFVIHDYVCDKATLEAQEGKYWEAVITRQEGDLLFKEMLLYLGCSRFKTYLMYKGVRVGAKSLNKYRPKKDEKKMK